MVHHGIFPLAWREPTQPGEDAMVDFDERDLVRYAQDTGFAEIELELRVSVKNHKEPIPWEQYLRISGNPLVPTTGEALDRVLSPQGVAVFTEYLSQCRLARWPRPAQPGHKPDFSHVVTACTAIRMPRTGWNDMKPRVHVVLAK